MFNSLKSIVYRSARPFENHLINRLQLLAKTGPETQIAQRQLFVYYRNLLMNGSSPTVQETGFQCFSQFDEDGKLLFVFAVLGIPFGCFLDIGAGDGINNSNCANLALNFGWHGVFIDGDSNNIQQGNEFYSKHPSTWAFPPKFVYAMVTRENINDILRMAAVPKDIDLMSIDIDGNDYWIWEALEYTLPKVVIIETHIEFGTRSIVVPYDKDYVYPGKHPDYHGASPTAMVKLANKKGYRLIGSNNYGFNTIYVRKDLGEELLPEVSVETVLAHPRNSERSALFEAIKDWDYVDV